MDAGDGHTYYDISLVDGYNLPLAIVLRPDSGGVNRSLDTIPSSLTNPSCVGSVGNFAGSGYNPYSQGSFLGTTAQDPLPFDNSISTNQVATWCPWNLQATGTSGPLNGVYVYPDGNLQRPVFNPCYSACAK